jgi:hypothetical protein
MASRDDNAQLESLARLARPVCEAKTYAATRLKVARNPPQYNLDGGDTRAFREHASVITSATTLAQERCSMTSC